MPPAPPSTRPVLSNPALPNPASPPVDPRDPDFIAAFGAALRQRGAIDDVALARAERAVRDTGERFDVVLSRLGLIDEATLSAAAAAHLGREFLTLRQLPETAPLDGLDPAYLRQARIVPVRDDGTNLTVAVADPFTTDGISALSFLLGRPVTAAIATDRDIGLALDRLYPAPGRTAATEANPAAAREDDVRRLADLASEAPVIRLVHDAIVRAVEARASDIHLEPGDDGHDIRLRIDGNLETAGTIRDGQSAAAVSRIKIMAKLDIAERRMPQDGRMKVNVRGREVDLRVSTMPTLKGESVVLRILDRSQIALDFESLGFDGPTLAAFLELIEKPNGLILVTGPTGSGKSTTLYTALMRLAAPFRKTFSIEDPVEYQLGGVAQVQVQPKIGLTFASALRSILRQDPDVIMVGEIRDLETAQMAVQAALTGHLVLSTLHTNGAAATIARLVDMGVDDYLIASTLKGTLAQRLVRRLCPECATPTEATPALRACAEAAGLNTRTTDWSGVKAPRGCPGCRGTGFNGRIAVCELMPVTPAVASAIVGRGTGHSVEAAAATNGLPTMMADGIAKILAGQTTLEDVLRVTRAT
ncbi:MAG: GspE/PulE family protein [Hyphomicrobiaceae bacterium]|nr:GspE/PulE family protein [Hyphomicrobiaceae bacterium]